MAEADTPAVAGTPVEADTLAGADTPAGAGTLAGAGILAGAHMLQVADTPGALTAAVDTLGVVLTVAAAVMAEGSQGKPLQGFRARPPAWGEAGLPRDPALLRHSELRLPRPR
ncbi:hypothetical protein CLOM_g13394 [Closterium sp. NIES-68]|nr:hypothetical protein CLOM_g13394 [Closterium sp. NIES-68]GJP72406.1 hypothetical protein CLOP_g3142 [Closterium sp. NIES-67]GJP80705.1 hypothetical protein CLOP_g10910 [Closterium sp. NIES-67]